MSEVNEEQVAQEVVEWKGIRQKRIQNERLKLMDRMSSKYERFPDETFEKLIRNNILQSVLEHLDPPTSASAYSCCPTFHSICEESVLVNVFSLLRNKGWLYLKRRDQKHGSHWLNNHNIWTLRLVSKTWKRATEHVFMNEFSNPSWYVNYPREYPGTHPVARTKFEGVKKATNEMEPPQAHPNTVEGMIRASKTLEGSDSREMLCQVFLLGSGQHDGWWRATLDFLGNHNHGHGRLIRGACIHCDQYLRTAVDRYMLLFHYLNRMPNLQWLILINEYLSQSDIDAVNDLLRDVIEKHPLPTIQPLTMIMLKNEMENEHIVNEVLRANPHVKSLELPRGFPVTEAVQLRMQKLTNLNEYRIRYAEHGSLTQLTMVLSEANKWPLKHLSIGVVYGVSIDTLFNLINRFGSTLQTLALWLKIRNVKLHHRLELPNLKKMEFHRFSWHSDVGLDFMLPCRYLEQLHFEELLKDHDNDNSSTSTGSVLIGYRNTVEESSLWIWFPRLVCVRLEEYPYTEREKRSPEHYVRKGCGVVKVPPKWNCEVECKKYKYF